MLLDDWITIFMHGWNNFFIKWESLVVCVFFFIQFRSGVGCLLIYSSMFFKMSSAGDGRGTAQASSRSQSRGAVCFEICLVVQCDNGVESVHSYIDKNKHAFAYSFLVGTEVAEEGCTRGNTHQTCIEHTLEHPVVTRFERLLVGMGRTLVEGGCTLFRSNIVEEEENKLKRSRR